MSLRVGVLLPHVGRWWFGEVLAGLEAVLLPADCEIIVFPVVDDVSRGVFFERLPDRAHLVDALVVVAMPLTNAEAARAKAAVAVLGTLGTKLPTVTSVRIDERRGVGLAMEHLVGLGHRRIALISGDPHEPWHFTAARQRRDAYRQFLQRHGLHADPALDVPGYWTVRGGAAAVGRLFAVAEPPTAVFALSDEMAIGASHALTRRGLRVPEDVSVCGFDDHPDADTFGLTTVHQPAYDCGARLAAEIVARLRQRQAPADPVPGAGGAPARPRRLGPAGVLAQPPRRLASFEHIVHDVLTLVPRSSTGPTPHGASG